jgi:hypothetical protein
MLQKISQGGMDSIESQRDMEGNNSSRIKSTNSSRSPNNKIPSKVKKVTTNPTTNQNLTQQIQNKKIETPRGMAMPELDQTNEEPRMEVDRADQPFNFSCLTGKDLSYLNYLNNPKDYIQPNAELQNLTPKVGHQKMKYHKRVTSDKFSMRHPSTLANISSIGVLDQSTNNKKVLPKTEGVRSLSEYLKPGSQPEKKMRSLANLKKVVGEASQENFPREVSLELAPNARQKFILTSQVNLNP